MEESQRVPCPYCRELILPGAVKCKECGSNLGGRVLMSRQMVWARNFPDRKLLGVASCIAHNLGVSPTLVRLLFVLLTFVSLLGLFLYIALALLIPAAPGQRSAFEAVVDAIGAAFDNFRSQPVTAQGIAGSSVAGECTSTAAPSAANAQAAPAPVAVAVPPPPPDSGGTPGTGV